MGHLVKKLLIFITPALLLATYALAITCPAGGFLNAVSPAACSTPTGTSIFAKGTLSATAPAVVGCNDTTTSVTSATTAMTVAVSPQANPNGGGVVTWAAYISAAGTLDIRLCAITVDAAPPAVTYNFIVFN